MRKKKSVHRIDNLGNHLGHEIPEGYYKTLIVFFLQFFTGTVFLEKRGPNSNLA